MTANRFPAACVRCGEPVAPGEGSVIGGKSADGSWTVTHHECTPVVDVVGKSSYWKQSNLRRIRHMVEALEELSFPELKEIRSAPETARLRQLLDVVSLKLEYDL